MDTTVVERTGGQQVALPPITLDEAMTFIWYEADLLDSATYDEWLPLWTATSRYVVPIDPATDDFESVLNYAYDDHTMRQKRAERLTSGQSVSALAGGPHRPAAVPLPDAGQRRGGLRGAFRPAADGVPPRAGADVCGRRHPQAGADGGWHPHRAEGHPPDRRGRGPGRHRLYPVTEPAPGHVALVTGGGNGLGAAIAGALHRAFYRVGVADVDEGAAGAVARGLDPSGLTAVPVLLDVRSKPAFEAALDDLVGRWGGAHVLVNNAAMTVARPVMEISPDEFDEVIAVNLRGTFLGCQVFGAHFRDRGYGRIVNMASLAGQNGGTATGAHYAASKGGIITLTKVFARDLAGSGVTANAIAPGPLDTPAVRRTLSEERLAAVREMIPVGDIGDPAFIAGLVVHLASPDAGFVSGATWDVNGGLFMR